MIDFIVVGQGLAGSLLAEELIGRGAKVKVYNDPSVRPATVAAAGLINPISGRKYNKSWLIDELLPLAKSTYTRLGELCGHTFCREVDLIRVVPGVRELNDWSIRRQAPGFENYIGNSIFHRPEWPILQGEGCFNVHGSLQLNSRLFIQQMKSRFIMQGVLCEEAFDWEALQLMDSGVTYKGLNAQYVISSDGWQGGKNKFFSFLPMQAAKGEYLVLRIKGLPSNTAVLSGNIALVPMFEEDLFYAGATYAWEFSDDLPTQQMKEKLEKEVKEWLTIPFEIAGQVSGIRPATIDRLPFIGPHPQFSRLISFNGLGTKGISLAPYFAQQLSDFLIDGRPLLPEVLPARFVKMQ